MRMLRIGFTTIVVIGHELVVVMSFLLASAIRYDGNTRRHAVASDAQYR